MNVSYQWLSQYIDLTGVTAEEIAERMTRAGIEIDSVENRNQGLDHIVVGYVVSKEKHPDADKLNVCQVDVGAEEKLQIVCGAKNVDAGQKVPVATIGAVMPGGMKIKRAKLRGVESQGMICSAKELGMNDKLLPKEMQEGILVLPAETELGTSIADVLGLNDHVLELDLTPNRSDCLSMLGVAHEVSALLERPAHLPEQEVKESAEAASGKVKISISAAEGCTHYAARYIAGVTIKPSPLWLQNRLLAAGVRPINNIVDVTNFVMLEYGQPLHAFDADKLNGGGTIDVRFANEGEELVTLDGQERKLEPHMLLITDGVKPVALAGVMGGENSEVSSDTVNILLESAHFAGSVVRKTSRQLGLRSEASLRFEKEVNPESVIPALNRAAELIRTLAEGEVYAGIVEQQTASAERKVIELTLNRTNRLLGTSLTSEEVRKIMSRLGFELVEKSEGIFDITVPTRRGDITRDVDLIEEVARIFGYDNIPVTAIEGATTPGHLTKGQLIRRAIRRVLTDNGVNEVVTYSFTNPADTSVFPSFMEGAVPVRLAMPMSEERSVLRTNLVPGLIDVAVYNRNRKHEDVSIFELGTLHLTKEEQLSAQPEEALVASLLMTGKRSAAQWNVKAEPVDFYDLKGVLDSLVAHFGLDGRVRYVADRPQGLHPGRSASLYLTGENGEQYIGFIGQLHPEVQHAKDVVDTYVAEFLVQPLIDAADFDIEYRSLPRYPAVDRDIAVVLDRGTEVGQVVALAKETAGELLESVNVFDVYTGDHVAADKKSVAISLVYRHPEHTFTDEEITELHGKVVTAIETSFNAELRK